MNRKYRKTIIAGNWKMHKTATETKRFAERLKGALPRSKRCSIVLCVPYVDIPAAVKLLKDSRVAVGAQNLHWEASGPFTGEISAAMLADLDVKYVIIGHSERRAHFGESDLIINKKIHAALAAGLAAHSLRRGRPGAAAAGCHPGVHHLPAEGRPGRCQP